MIRAFKYRLYPTKSQRIAADAQLFEACKLYNVALEQRIMAYRSCRKNVSSYDQAAELKTIRAEGLCKIANHQVANVILRKIDRAFRDFFNRFNNGKKPGFPRFKAARRYHTIEYPLYGNGCKLKGNRVYLQGIGNIKIRLHRPVEGNIKIITLTKKNDKYYIAFCCEVAENFLQPIGNEIGIDMGIDNYLVTSKGEFIENPRYFQSAHKKFRVLQRSVCRKIKGSNRRKKSVSLLAKQHEKISNQRHDFAHKLSYKIITENDNIYIEDLNIHGLAKGILARSVNDAAWGIFLRFLTRKAENAGRMVIKVDPRGTSQRCNVCGTEVKKVLHDRWHRCPICGESCHRDLNSAKEILRLGTNRKLVTCAITQCVGFEAN